MATSRAERVIGIHFFNPVPVMPLVELVTSLQDLAADDRERPPSSRPRPREAGHHLPGPGRIRGQRATRPLPPVRHPDARVGLRDSAGDIDAGMRLGCAHPMGPLELADLIGLDTTAAIAESMYEEFKEPQLAPPALLLRMVKAQHLGRKTGRGFFEYACNREAPTMTMYRPIRNRLPHAQAR